MQLLLQFIPLVVVLCLYAASVRLAARLTRASGVGWLRAFQFAALIIVLSILGRVVSIYAGELPLLLAGLYGIAVHLALGGWFFRHRALAQNGEVVGWAGGAKLGGVALGLVFLVMAALFGVVHALLQVMQP